MKYQIIRYLGGYPTIDDALKAIKKDDFPRKNEVITEAVKHLFNTVGPEDILRHIKGQWFLGKRQLSDAEINLLREEAKLFFNTRLWKLLQKVIQNELNKKMFLEASITQDMLWGKLITFYNDIINTILKKLLTYEKS